MKSLLRLLRFLFWWIVILITVAVIGFFLWPLLSGKVNTLRSGDWNSGDATSDVIQMTLEQKIKSFFHISTTATRDVLTDESGKKTVEYKQDDAGAYLPVPVEAQPKN